MHTISRGALQELVRTTVADWDSRFRGYFGNNEELFKDQASMNSGNVLFFLKGNGALSPPESPAADTSMLAWTRLSKQVSEYQLLLQQSARVWLTLHQCGNQLRRRPSLSF